MKEKFHQHLYVKLYFLSCQEKSRQVKKPGGGSEITCLGGIASFNPSPDRLAGTPYYILETMFRPLPAIFSIG